MAFPTPCPAHTPEDWLAMRQAIWEWVRAEIDSGIEVIWAKQPAPAPPQPYVWLQVLLPPARQGQDEVRTVRGVAVLMSAQGAGTVHRMDAPADPSDPLSALVGAQYVEVGSDTAASVRDGLLAAIAISGIPGAGYTSQAFQSDAVYTFRADALPFDAEVSPGTDLPKTIEQLLGARTATFQVDAVAPKPALDAADPVAVADAALRIAQALQNSLEAPDVVERLKLAGWGVIGVEGNRKPDQVAGSEWEDRAGFDVRLSCRSRRIRLVDYIESATINATGSGSAMEGTIAS